MNSRREVSIVETSAYERKVSGLLSNTEQRAIQLVLADDPLCGEPVPRNPGLLKLACMGYVIWYSVSPSLTTIYLLDITKDGDGGPPPSKEQSELLRRVLVSLASSGVIAIVRTGLRWIKDYLNL